MTPTELRDAIAPHIAALSQSEVARRSGVAQANISNWLRTGRGLSMDSIRAIVTALGGRLETVLHLPPLDPRP